jgi:hypothetical protein
MVPLEMTGHQHKFKIVNSTVCPICKQHDFRKVKCSLPNCGLELNQNVGDHAHQSPGVQRAQEH